MSLKLIRKDIGGKFVGREELVQKIYSILDRGMPGVALVGMTGSGKSTLLARMGALLQSKGYKVVPVAGKTSAELILSAIAAAAKDAGVAEAEQTFASPMEFVQKLYWLAENFFIKEKVLLLLDDFHHNLDDNGAISNANLQEMVEFFNTSLQYKSSAYLIASERELEGFDHVEIPEFTRDEFLESMVHTRALQRMPQDELARIADTFGGSPLTMDLLDGVAQRDFPDGAISYEALMESIPGFEADPREATINALFAGLKPERLDVMKIFAMYGFPLTRRLVLAHGIEDGAVSREDLDALEALNLLEFDTMRAVYHAHPAVAESALRGVAAGDLNRFHQQVADRLLEEGAGEEVLTIDYQLEALSHLKAAGLWERVVDTSLRVERELVAKGFPQLAFELLDALKEVDTSSQNRLAILQRLGFLHSLFGQRDEAVSHTEQALELGRDAGDRGQEAMLLQQLGTIYSREKERDQALTYYLESLALARELDEAPLRLFNLQQIGGIYMEEERWDDALPMFQEALEEYNRRKEINGASMCLGQLGRIHFERGDLKEALMANLKAFVAYSRLGYPDARAARREVMRVREAMGAEEFNAILEEFQIPTDMFDPDKEDQQKSLDFLRRTVLEAAAAKGKGPAEKQHAHAYIDQILAKAPEGNPELEGFKNFFRMLKAYVDDQDLTPFQQNVPAGLLAIFKEVTGA